ncbi:MAG: hypothetical protein AAF694_14420 [Bacteroidota bacterium]
MPDEQPKSWVLIIVAIISTAGIIIAAWIQNPKDDEPCQIEPFLIQYSNSFQVNGYQIPGEINPEWSPRLSELEVIEFAFNPSESPEAFFQARHEKVQSKISTVIARHAGFIDIPGFIELNNYAQQKSKDRTVDPIFREMFTVKYDSIISYNCVNQQFQCKLGLAYNPEALRFPPELLRLIYNELLKIREIQNFMGKPLGTSLNSTALKLQLAKNSSFIAKYCNEVQTNWEHYRIFYPNLEDNKCDVLFRSGDYNVNPVSLAIIKILAEVYYDYVRLRPDSTFQLTCTGFSDGAKVKSPGIPYMGAARWSSNSSEIRYINPNSGASIEGRTDTGQVGNHQLAYIRAHMGLMEMKRAFELLNGGRENFFKLNPMYAGNEPPRDNIASEEDRRIEFKLITP